MADNRRRLDSGHFVSPVLRPNRSPSLSFSRPRSFDEQLLCVQRGRSLNHVAGKKPFSARYSRYLYTSCCRVRLAQFPEVIAKTTANGYIFFLYDFVLNTFVWPRCRLVKRDSSIEIPRILICESRHSHTSES